MSLATRRQVPGIQLLTVALWITEEDPSLSQLQRQMTPRPKGTQLLSQQHWASLTGRTFLIVFQILLCLPLMYCQETWTAVSRRAGKGLVRPCELTLLAAFTDLFGAPFKELFSVTPISFIKDLFCAVPVRVLSHSGTSLRFLTGMKKLPQ